VEGAYIRYIDPESCAQAAGLQLGDIIYRFGAMDVYSRDDLQAAVRSYHAGDTVEMGVYRNQQYLTIMVTLDENIPEGASHDGRSEFAPLSYQSYSSPF
jgi:serine protease Do